MSLAIRAIAEERMDADDLDADTYAAVVGDLARVNVMTMAARPTLGFLGRATLGMTRVRVLDVGFGDGDMLRRIARWAARRGRSEEHTSELQSLMRISYAVFCLKKKK